MMKKVGVIAENRLFDHRILKSIQESPERLFSTYLSLKDSYWADKIVFYPARPATEQELLMVHSPLYLNQIRQYCVHEDNFAYDKDTYLMEESFFVASLATGSVLTLADAIFEGEIEQGFAIVRPPGHHAEPGRGRGFCIFNNVAVAARYIQKKYAVPRILIFDFDAHHGNGTQQAFYTDNSVVCISFHERNLFPSDTGEANEFGQDKGYGYNINIPVYSNYGDVEYSYLLGQIVQETVMQYEPELIIVSAGFDGHQDETISSLTLTTEWFSKVMGIMKHFAFRYSDRRLLVALEGGYKPETVESCVLATLDALYRDPPISVSYPFSSRAVSLMNAEILPCIRSRWSSCGL